VRDINTIIFYLASKYDKRETLLPIAALLMLHGHTIQAEWLNGSHIGTSEEEKASYAKIDLANIDMCTHFVMFQLPVEAPESSTGRQVEFGYALAKGKHCIIVGDGASIFYTQAKRYDTIGAFLAVYAANGKL
jgi:nucleoside 2-deoxyribosyltransferase